MKTSHYIIIAVLAVSVLTPAFADTVTVDMPEGTGIPGCEVDNACFVPYEVTVDVGGEVTWTNSDTTLHFVSAGDLSTDPNMIGVDYPNGFDSGIVNPGTEFSHTFEDAGTYPYLCVVHPWKAGIVYVENTNQNQNIPTNSTSPITEPQTQPVPIPTNSTNPVIDEMEDMMEDGPIQNSTNHVYEDMTDDNEEMEEWPIVVQLRTMIAELEATITGLEAKITELKEDKQNKNAKIAELRDKLKAKNNQTENQDVKLQTKLENKNAKIDRLENKIVKLEKIIDRKDSKIDRKDTNVDNKKEKIGIAQDDLNAQANEIESLKGTIQNQTSIIEGMKAQMGEMQTNQTTGLGSFAIAKQAPDNLAEPQPTIATSGDECWVDYRGVIQKRYVTSDTECPVAALWDDSIRVKQWHENGNMEYHKYYAENDGLHYVYNFERAWYENGQMKLHEYRNDKGVEIVERWHENGQQSYYLEMCYQPYGSLDHSHLVIWNENGMIMQYRSTDAECRIHPDYPDFERN